MIEKINIKNKRYKVDFEVYLVWLTWFPFIGWMYPFIFIKDDSFAMHHAKQAFVLACFFTLVPIIITFSTAFIPITYRVPKLILVILIYLSHVTYFCVCAWGLLKIREKAKYEFPLVTRYANKLNV